MEAAEAVVDLGAKRGVGPRRRKGVRSHVRLVVARQGEPESRCHHSCREPVNGPPRVDEESVGVGRRLQTHWWPRWCRVALEVPRDRGPAEGDVGSGR